jgi:hypothetical protein
MAERRSLPAVALFLAVVAGAAIRLDQIADQIPGDDEWHALHALLAHPYAWILQHLGGADYCIPLTVYDKLVADTIGLSELWMRLPGLLAGIAAIALLPRLLRPELGTKASLVLAWLLAISPLHVYFSRYARPYAPAFLLSVLAVIALDRWRRTRAPRWGILTVLAAVLAPWFHPVFLPFTLAPFAWILVRRALDGPAPQPAGSVWPLALGITGGLVALLGAPVATDFQSLRDRSDLGGHGIAPPAKVFELLSGANQPLLAFGFGLALVLGVVAMRGKWKGVLGALLFASLCQAVAVLVVGPAEIRVPITTARYLFPALAALLCLAALGLVHLDGLLRKEWKRFPPHAATAVLGAALLAFGPLPAVHYRPNGFTNHTIFQYDYSPSFPHNFAARNLGLKGLPAFYARLAQEPADGRRIVEAPWFYEWHRDPFPLYQRVHRWPVLVGFIARPGEPLPLGELPWPDPRFRFRNFVHVGDLRAMREKRVRYVVFHKDPPRPPEDDLHPGRAATEAWIAQYRTDFGDPVAEDDDLCVFDLDRAR